MKKKDLSQLSKSNVKVLLDRAMSRNDVDEVAYLITNMVEDNKKRSGWLLSGHKIPDQRIERWIQQQSLNHHPGIPVIRERTHQANGTVYVNQSTGMKKTHKWFYACAQGRVEWVKESLKNGVCVNAVDESGMTGLMHAIIHNHEQVVEVLLKDKGVVLDQKNTLGETALMLSVKHGRIQMMYELMNLGADIHECNHHGHTLWMLAILHQQGQMIRFLQSLEVLDLNAIDKKGRTGLMYAAWCSSYSGLLDLLCNPALDASIKDHQGLTVWDFIHASVHLSDEEKDILLQDQTVQKMVDCGESLAVYLGTIETPSEVRRSQKRMKKKTLQEKVNVCFIRG